METRKTNVRTGRRLPDVQVCRAVPLTERFAECLVAKPVDCPYAIPFGFSFMCGNPDHEAIIANTKRAVAAQRERRQV